MIVLTPDENVDASAMLQQIDHKPELTEEELDFLEEWIDDCGGEEEWSESWDGYDV